MNVYDYVLLAHSGPLDGTIKPSRGGFFPHKGTSRSRRNEGEAAEQTSSATQRKEKIQSSRHVGKPQKHGSIEAPGKTREGWRTPRAAMSDNQIDKLEQRIPAENAPKTASDSL